MKRPLLLGVALCGLFGIMLSTGWAQPAEEGQPPTDPPAPAEAPALALPTPLLTCTAPATMAAPGGTVMAQLTDTAGAPLPDRTLHWQAQPSAVFTPRSGVTNDEGATTTRLIVPFDAGLDREQTVTATFDGDEHWGPALCDVVFHLTAPALPTPARR